MPTDVELTTAAIDDDWLDAYADPLRRSLRGSGRVLELGCGEGRDTIQLVRCGDVVAIDRSGPSLHECRSKAPQAMQVCADLGRPLPVRSGLFPVVVASLSLHYFSWTTSRRLVAEIRRVMVEGGLLIVRVNSTRDVNHGAVGHPEIEPNLYDVRGFPKRFFDRTSLLALFGAWIVESIEERVILRYEKPKWIWELQLRAA